MHKLKVLLKNLLYALYGYFSACYTPVFLGLAFNFTDGVQNNPEGAMFIPVGIIILLAVLIIDVLIVVKTIRSDDMTKLEKTLTILAFAVIKIIGLTVDRDGWRNFLHCLSRHLERLSV